MIDQTTDIRELLRCLQAGDEQALAPLFSQYRERLRRMVEFRMDVRLRGRVSTSDVLQEAYIDALKRLPHFRADPSVPFFIWLRTVTIQRLIETHRHHLGAKLRNAAKERPLATGDLIEASSETMVALIVDLTSPSQAVERLELMAQLRAALDSLDRTDREILALRHFEELSNQEVAALLGIQPAAASKRYVRAIERLKETLERLPGFAEDLR